MSIKSGKKALFTEINITPLTDIFLVLLIIMMVIAPSFQSVDNTINIPEVNSGNTIEQGKLTISVTKDGNIFIDETKTPIDKLASELEARKKDSTKNEIVVKADEKVKSSVIMDIMDAAQDAHYKKLIVAGEPLNKKAQKALEQKSKDNDKNIAKNKLEKTYKQDNQYENWSE